MDDNKKSVAKACLDGAEANTMTFPQIVGTLMQDGFESYAIDFRRAVATYYLPDGDTIELPTHKVDVPIAASFDVSAIQVAIKDAQQLVPGYTYKGFCTKVALVARATSSRCPAAARFMSAAPPRHTSNTFQANLDPQGVPESGRPRGPRERYLFT
jgi:hypothetical protein